MPTVTINKENGYNCDGKGCCGGTTWKDISSLKRSFNCAFCDSYLRDNNIKVKDNRNSGEQITLFENNKEKICPLCEKKVKELELDICPEKQNLSLCPDCIRKRHEGLRKEEKGFIVKEDMVEFYSATTGWEMRLLSEIFRVFNGCFSNSVFPYSINCEDEVYAQNCFGVTKEFGDWLISQGIKSEVSEENLSDDEDYSEDNLEEEDDEDLDNGQ